MAHDELTEVLCLHGAWLRDEPDGKRADLSGADLSGANLSRANLSRADLSGADLSRADLSRADLFGADLSGADLSSADLSGAYLFRADLFGAYLFGATRNDIKQTKAPLCVIGGEYPAMIWDSHIEVGCSSWSHADLAALAGDNRAKRFAAGHALLMAAIAYHTGKES